MAAIPGGHGGGGGGRSDPPLAPGEDITHTNADITSLLLSSPRPVLLALPPLTLRVVTAAVPFTGSRDPDTDGLVRQEAGASGLWLGVWGLWSRV